jgi:uncharacterized protein YbjT (DUF2867 family)
LRTFSYAIGRYIQSMPVVVTGASGFIGRHAVAAFLRSSPQVRAYVRRPKAADELRKMGAKVAVGEITDVDELAVVMSGAHTVCHLLPLTEDEAEVRYLEPVVLAAEAAGVRRILFLTGPHKADPEGSPVEQIQEWAEKPLVTSNLEWVVIRSAPIYGPDSPWLLAMAKRARRHPAIVWGSGKQALAPVFVDDVTAVLVAADDRGGGISGVWSLEGPDLVTADAFADMLAGSRRFKLHVSLMRAANFGRGRRPRMALLRALSGHVHSGAPDAAAEFGVTLTPLEEGLRRSVPA